MTIHWCGTGLSAIPGLRRLIETGKDVQIWNRSVEKAQAALGDLTDRIAPFDTDALAASLSPGDIMVSMLPGEWDVPLARICVEKEVNFISSSYISPEMAALNTPARLAGVALVGEVGLDPGIDHLMAHWLVEDYRDSPVCEKDNAISFTSYCGGIPRISNAFRYKFSWSPLGVLKALLAPSRSLRAFSEMTVAHPWDAISTYTAPLHPPERFEVYPNRDSIPFMQRYHFDGNWPVREFVRGTLRLYGWAEAWKDVFAEMETLDGKAGEERLEEMANQLWAENAYNKDEPDRVVLCVSLKAEKAGQPVYHKTYALDAWGDLRGSAMARLVSQTVSLAVEAVEHREIMAGVSAAPSDPKLIKRWMAQIDKQAQHLEIVDHLQR